MRVFAKQRAALASCTGSIDGFMLLSQNAKGSVMIFGWVYVLSNRAMPGLIKIGQSAADPNLRASELHTTGVPEAFTVEYKGLFSDHSRLERLVHNSLGQHRISSQREFFRIEAQIAVERIRALSVDGPKFEVCNFSVSSETKGGAGIAHSARKASTDPWPKGYSLTAERRILQAERARLREARAAGELTSLGFINCKSCGALISSSQVICPNCKADPARSLL